MFSNYRTMSNLSLLSSVSNTSNVTMMTNFSNKPINPSDTPEDNEPIANNPEWRTGKWTIEEEVYAAKLIEFFTTGQLVLEYNDGRTLRSFLAKRLNCNPMRISKKFSCLEGMGVRYQQVEYCSERLLANQEILRAFEKSYREKDVHVQSRRIKRRQYRQNSEEKARLRNEFNKELGIDKEVEADDVSTDDEGKAETIISFSSLPNRSLDDGLELYLSEPSGTTSVESADSITSHTNERLSSKRKHEYTVAFPDLEQSKLEEYKRLYNIKRAKLQTAYDDFKNHINSYKLPRSLYTTNKSGGIGNSTNISKFTDNEPFQYTVKTKFEQRFPTIPEDNTKNESNAGASLLLEAARILASGFEPNAKECIPLSPTSTLPPNKIERNVIDVNAFNPL